VHISPIDNYEIDDFILKQKSHRKEVMDKYESTLNSMINKCGDIVREINNNVKIDDDEEEEQNKFG